MKKRFTLAAAILFAASIPLFGQTTEGMWTTTVETDAGTLEATAVPPLGKDDLNCNRKVIPVKFALEDTDLLLSSNTADTDTTNDFSTLTFDPTDELTVSELTNLTAIYEVAEGNCGGGSLRWQIDTSAGNVFVYYGTAPDFTDCSGEEGQSGINLLSLDDARVDSSQVYAGTQYNTWDAFVAANPDLVVEDVNLVADGGWSQPDGVQSFTIESATVNDNTYTGDSLACDLPDATIRVSNSGGAPITVQSIQGVETLFREDDCQYIYNLVNPGPGTYTVEILVGDEVIGSTTLTISCRGSRRR